MVDYYCNKLEDFWRLWINEQDLALKAIHAEAVEYLIEQLLKALSEDGFTRHLE